MILAMFLLGWSLLRTAFRRQLTSFELWFAYPVGLSLTGLYLFLTWSATIPFLMSTLVWWLLVLMSAGWVQWKYGAVSNTVSLWKGAQKELKEVANKLTQLSLPFSAWPLLYMGAAIALAVGIAFVWQLTITPVSWDAVALYDFRAQRVVDGWQLADFAGQFARMEEYRAYDFLHPITSSLWWALAYQSGARMVLLLYSVLLLCVLGAGWQLWKSWQSRLVWPFLWLSMPALFVSLTEGYGAYPSALFWVLGLLWITERIRRHKWLDVTFIDWGVLGALVLGSVSARITEYYWFGALLFSLFGFAYLVKFQGMKIVKSMQSLAALWILPAVSVAVWFAERSWAVALTGTTDEDRSVSALAESLLSQTPLALWNAFQEELGHWLFSPALPWIVLLVFAVIVFWRVKNRWPKEWTLWTGMAGIWLVFLLAGMIALHVVFGERWVEARQAMDRAILPILGVCFIWLTDLTERFSQDSAR
ncbi:hypothetical protein LRY58_00990 [Candidatus Woesebacteria bacterium]|nr:hypothetical protein [Candidatus Woesebacteria bacterium]